MKIIFTLFFAVFSVVAFAQSNKEQAIEMAKEAITLMEDGQTKEAIEMLKKSEKLDPGNVIYPYEIAYAHYLDKDYKKCIKVLKGLKKHPQVMDKVYQMLGNAYDMDGKPAKAIATYDEGLKKFPKSGPLHLERGNMEMGAENYTNALSYYEKGIELDPRFPSNYYWATKLYLLGTDEEVWGMMYGEIFMNLERNTKRTAEISKLLYDTYKKEIQITSDTSFSVSFSKNATIQLNNAEDFKLPFGIGVYEPLLMVSLIQEKEINMASLDRIRTNFVVNYFEKGHEKSYPNVLFDYQKKLNESGYFDCYNYWILMQGDSEEFKEWRTANTEKWTSFMEWFGGNGLTVNENNRFHRLNY